MRVLDCNKCGETLSAANDAELATQLIDHFEDRHDDELDEDRADAMVADQAYDAADA